MRSMPETVRSMKWLGGASGPALDVTFHTLLTR